MRRSSAVPVRHGRLRRRSAARDVARVAVSVVAVLVVGGGSVGAIAAASIGRTVAENAVDLDVGAALSASAAPPPVGEVEGGFDLLVVGADNDAAQGDEYGGRDATLNDVNILLHVARDHRSAVVVSLPRDLLVDRPDCTDPETGVVTAGEGDVPLNSTFSVGGLACVNRSVEQLTGLDIPYAGWISFQGVIEMSDAVGGVDICLTGAVRDTDSGLDLPAGTSTVSGATALAFLRTRHGVGDGSDLARISSQQQFLSSLMRKVKSSGTLSDAGALYGLAHAASHAMHLSTSMTEPRTLIGLALALKDVELDRLVFVQYPGSTGDPDFPGKVVPDPALGPDLMAKVRDDVPFTPAAPQGVEVAESGAEESPAVPEGAAPAATGAVAPVADPLPGITGQKASDRTCAEPAE